jgi:hypothetical protein
MLPLIPPLMLPLIPPLMLPLMLPLVLPLPEPSDPTPRFEMPLGSYGRHGPVGWYAGRFCRNRFPVVTWPLSTPVNGSSDTELSTKMTTASRRWIERKSISGIPLRVEWNVRTESFDSENQNESAILLTLNWERTFVR